MKPNGIMGRPYTLNKSDPRFRRLFGDAIVRPSPDLPKIHTVSTVSLSRHPTSVTVGLTRYSRVRFFLLTRPRQTITFYSSLLGALTDPAATAVIAHELAHAWLNEHTKPEESGQREREADSLAKDWGFGPELRALEKEAESVN